MGNNFEILLSARIRFLQNQVLGGMILTLAFLKMKELRHLIGKHRRKRYFFTRWYAKNIPNEGKWRRPGGRMQHDVPKCRRRRKHFVYGNNQSGEK